jgi:hypothetical protein
VGEAAQVVLFQNHRNIYSLAPRVAGAQPEDQVAAHFRLSGKTSESQPSLIPLGACLSQTICNDGIYGRVKCQSDVRA